MKRVLSSREIVLLQNLIAHINFPLLDVIRLSVMLLEECAQWRGSITSLEDARKAIKLGAKALFESEQTISFAEAVEVSISVKAHRRERTLAEIRYVCNKIMSNIPNLSERPVRTVTTKEWIKYIDMSFQTSRQKHKARIILHGIFSLMVKREWCFENPISKIDIPALQEKAIKVLSPQEVARLIDCARNERNGDCLAAVAMMLYAGVRPREVQRLTWHDISMEQNIISLSPIHSKTGGARHITLEPILKDILLKYAKEHSVVGTDLICPKNWLNKWVAIREKAGWNTTNPWEQDCLRHSYASYHALKYKDFTRLQYEMGHASAALLRTRYLNMGSLKPDDAQVFWGITD